MREVRIKYDKEVEVFRVELTNFSTKEVVMFSVDLIQDCWRIQSEFLKEGKIPKDLK